MKRLTLLLLLLASTVFAQTYVRPSKGISFIPFSDMRADAGVVIPNPTSGISSVIGSSYDWTAFDAVQIMVYPYSTDPLATGYYGQLCSTIGSRKYIVPNIGPYIRFRRYKFGTSGVYLRVEESPTSSASTYEVSTAPNANLSLRAYSGCAVIIQATPLPFSPASTVILDADGGVAPSGESPAAPFQCGQVYQKTYLMDGGIISMGVAPSGVGRYYSIVCNSRDNSSGVVRCRADGADAGVLSTTAGSTGDVLSVGDCISYSNPTSVPFYCIGSGNWTTLFECSPATP